MRMLDVMSREGFEQIVALSDPSCGLAGFMVLHDTTRGPATGGIRIFGYQDEETALGDGLKLARAMTLKAAVADLPVGGGKIVLIEHADLIREEALRCAGRAIDSLQGRFLAGRDVGVPVEQGRWVREETSYMVDETETGVGDLNRATALGVEAGARAAMRFRLGTDQWKGVRVAIQGVGGVGGCLAEMLAERGADIVAADPDERALEALAARTPFELVPPDAIYSASEELFCPCAVGGVLNDRTVDQLAARVVAGSANNVLADPQVGRLLCERHVAYAPDFLINAGALIQGVRFLLEGERNSADAISRIGEKVYELLEAAARDKAPPEVVLERRARQRLSPQRTWRNWYWPNA